MRHCTGVTAMDQGSEEDYFENNGIEGIIGSLELESCDTLFEFRKKVTEETVRGSSN